MDISSSPDEILSLYSKKMTSMVLDISGNEVLSSDGEKLLPKK